MNKKLVIICAIIISILGFSIYNTSATRKNDQTLIATATRLLDDGYKEDTNNYAASTWGKFTEAKNTIDRASNSTELKPEIEKVNATIEDRRYGQIVTNGLVTLASEDKNSLRDSLSMLKQVPNTSRHYEKSQEIKSKLTVELEKNLVQRAREHLDNGGIETAKSLAQEVSANSPYEPEAKQILKEISGIEQLQAERGKIAARKQYAKQLEKLFVDNMLDVYISIRGAKEDELHLKYVLWSRPLVNKFAGEGKIISTSRTLGFSKVTFDTGYRESWYYDL